MAVGRSQELIRTGATLVQAVVVVAGITFAVFEYEAAQLEYEATQLEYEATQRRASIQAASDDVQRVLEADFIEALHVMRGSVTAFEDKLNATGEPLNPTDRYERFWALAVEDEAQSLRVEIAMTIIGSRLDSLARCFESSDCDNETLFLRFPLSVYQRLVRLRPHLLRPLDAAAYWHLGSAANGFLCAYANWYRVYTGDPIETWAVVGRDQVYELEGVNACAAP